MTLSLFQFRWNGLIALAVLAALADDGPVAATEKSLRWKLQPDQTLRVRIEQTIRTSQTGAGKPASIVIDMLMEMTWLVNEVKSDGTAAMTQSVDRFKVRMATGKGPAIEYDSQSQDTVPRAAREFAESVGPLIGAKLSVVMNDRGEFLEVEPLGEKPAAESAAEVALFTRDGIAEVLRQSAVVLPQDPPDRGEKWTSQHTIASRLGKLSQTNSYTYVGSEVRGGQSQERIDVTSELKLLEPPLADRQNRSTIREQEHTGQLWFDAEAGRFVETESAQSLTLERPYRDVQIRIRTNTTTKMTISE